VAGGWPLGWSALELESLQLAKDLHTVTTDLTPEQVRDAENAFRRVVDRPQPLLFYVEFALAHYREAKNEQRGR
jgi:hypothetical protein